MQGCLWCVFPADAPPRAAPQSFSSVVGPNGSGKSNVIDALLFVFGKRAKQARRRPGVPVCVQT
jgi:AAA15 family ATPase/GTPase